MTDLDRTGSRWWFPDEGLGAGHLAHTREFVEQLPWRDHVLAALATGSRAVGLAHARSDLDIMLIFATDDDRRRYNELPRRYCGLTVDTDNLTVGDVERQVASVQARERAGALDRRLYAPGNLPWWSMLVRLTIGEVVCATPAVRALLGRLDRDAVRRSMMSHAVLCLATFVEDVSGSVECGDLATALSASEDAVRCAVEVSLAGLNDLYVGPKYLRRRMARHLPLANVLDQLGYELFGQPATTSGDHEVRRLVRWRLLVASHLAGQALLAAWERPMTDLPSFHLANAGPVRSPDLTPVRWPGGWGLMTGVEVTQSMSGESAALWLSLDGRPIESIVVEHAKRTGRDPHAVESQVYGVVNGWQDSGVAIPIARPLPA